MTNYASAPVLLSVVASSTRRGELCEPFTCHVPSRRAAAVARMRDLADSGQLRVASSVRISVSAA